MKKLYIFLLVLVLVIAGVTGFFVLNQNNFAPKQSQNTLPENLVQTKTISQKDNFFDVNAEYPGFILANTEFNKKIEDLVKNKIEEFKQNSQDTFKAINDTTPPGQKKLEYPISPFTFDCSFVKTTIDENYISFVLNLYYFTGGAHGANEVLGFNYDIKNKKEITVQDLLLNSQENLNKLSEVARKITYAQLKENDAFLEDMAEQGTEPIFENYKEFGFDNESLIIYFQRYQVSFGAAGPITIKIPFKDLKFAGIELTLSK